MSLTISLLYYLFILHVYELLFFVIMGWDIFLLACHMRYVSCSLPEDMNYIFSYCSILYVEFAV